MDSLGNSLLILASSASATPVLVQDTGAEPALRGDPAALTRWAGWPGGGQLGLLLDQIRGTHDATALHVSMRRPEADRARPAASQESLLATAALYGLRRASVAAPKQGLTLHLDITAHEAWLRPLLLASASAPLSLVIHTRPTLPTGVTISMTRVCIVSPIPHAHPNAKSSEGESGRRS